MLPNSNQSQWRGLRVAVALAVVVVVAFAVTANVPKSVRNVNKLSIMSRLKEKSGSTHEDVGTLEDKQQSAVMGSYCQSMCGRIHDALSDIKQAALKQKCLKNCMAAGTPAKNSGQACEGICTSECNGFGTLGRKDTCELTCASFCVALREELIAEKNDKKLGGQAEETSSQNSGPKPVVVRGDAPSWWSHRPYTIRNAWSQKVIDVPGQNFALGTQMIQYPKWPAHDEVNGCAQWWELVWYNRHVGPTAYIRNWCRKEWYLDIGGVGTHSGAPLTIWSYHGGNNQKFILQWTLRWNDVYLVAVHSNKVMDIVGPSSSAFAKIHQWSNYGGQNQKWVLDPVGW